MSNSELLHSLPDIRWRFASLHQPRGHFGGAACRPCLYFICRELPKPKVTRLSSCSVTQEHWRYESGGISNALWEGRGIKWHAPHKLPPPDLARPQGREQDPVFDDDWGGGRSRCLREGCVSPDDDEACQSALRGSRAQSDGPDTPDTLTPFSTSAGATSRGSTGDGHPKRIPEHPRIMRRLRHSVGLNIFKPLTA